MSIVAPITKALVAGGTEVVEALSSKLHQNTQEIFPSSIADDTASEMIDVVKTVNKNRGIQEDVTDKQIDYMERIHRREFKPHLLDRAIPNKDMKDEQLAQLIAEATEQKQLKNISDEIDEDGEIFTEIKSLLRNKGKHSKILNNFKYIEEDLGIEIEDDMFLPFINAQLNRLDGFDMLTEKAQNYFRKSAYHLLKNHPLTKNFRQEYPQPDVTGVRQQIPKYIDDETEDWYSALEQQWSVDPDKALPEDMRLAAREDFLGSSTVLVPVYRSSSSGWYLGWDPRLNSPNEIGLHLGTAGQAWALIAKKQVQELKDEGTFVTRKIKSRKAWERENYYHGDSQIDDAPFDYQQTDMWGDPNILDDERLILSGREYQTATIDEANTHAEGYARLRNPETPEKPHQIVKGYIRIRKPLIFPYKENGTWEALPILSYGDGMHNFHKNIARSLGHKNVSDSSPLPYSPEQMERLKELQARANKINEYKQLSYEKFGMPKAPKDSEYEMAVDMAKQMGLPLPPKPDKVSPKFKPELLPKTFKKQQKILDPSRDVDEDTIANELAMWRAGLSEKDEAIISRLDAGQAMAIDGVSPEGKFKDRLLVDMAEWQLNLDFQRWLSSFGFDGIKYINDVEPSFDVDTDHLYNFEEVKKQFKPFPEEEAYIETSIEGKDRHWSYIVFRPQQFKAENALKYDVEDARFGMNQGGRVMAAKGWFNLLRPQKEPAMWLREIKRGDTLSQIAKEFGRSVEEIAELNRIKDINKIRAGDKIYIPRQKVQPQQEKITRVDRPVQSIRKPPTQRRTTQNILTNIEEQARKNIAAAKEREKQVLKQIEQRRQQQKKSNIIVREPVPLTDTSALKGAVQSFFNSGKKEKDEKKLVEDIQAIHSAEIQNKPVNQTRSNLANYLFGNKKLLTNEDYNDETIEGVRLAAMKVMNNKNRPQSLIDTITYEDYQDGDNLRGLVTYQSKVGRDKGFISKLLGGKGSLTGSQQAGTSIGGGSLIHEKDGNTYLTDIYDYNPKPMPESFNITDGGVLYDWVRWGLGKANKHLPVNRFKTRLNLGPTENLRSGGGRSIVVGRGDTMGSIAKKYNTTVKNLMAVNDIENANRIKIGDVLNIG